MLANTLVKNCELYIGRGAGKEIENAVRNAKKSIYIISPFLSPRLVDLLIKKNEEGVEVKLITCVDFANRFTDKYTDIYKKLVRQNVTEDQKALNKRSRLRKVSTLLALIAFLLLGAGYIDLYNQPAILFITAAVLGVASLLVWNYSSNVAIYYYSYSSVFKTKTIVDYVNSEISDDYCYLPHAKAYILDEELAYLGSLNFTEKGLNFSYESRMKITDRETVVKLVREFYWLGENDRTRYQDITKLGSKFYQEPPH
jgi:phosphatidylserine/phosphatidylglycerophosphate/cardiolipin synthase-like enzyme